MIKNIFMNPLLLLNIIGLFLEENRREEKLILQD